MTDKDSSSPPSRRTSDRKAVLLNAEVKVAGQSYACEILNLSSGGAKLTFTQALEIGQKITLVLDPLGDFSGEVAWQTGSELGVSFCDDSEQTLATVLGIAIYG